MPRKRARNDNSHMPFDFENFWSANQSALSGFTGWNETISRFCNHRCKEYFELPSRLSGCKSPQDVVEVQWQFLGRLFNDYQDEAKRLLGRANDIAEEGFQFGEKLNGSNGRYEKSLLEAQKDASEIIQQGKAQADRIIDEAEARADEILKRPRATRGRRRAA